MAGEYRELRLSKSRPTPATATARAHTSPGTEKIYVDHDEPGDQPRAPLEMRVLGADSRASRW
jgi:hypothetical protein